MEFFLKFSGFKKCLFVFLLIFLIGSNIYSQTISLFTWPSSNVQFTAITSYNDGLIVAGTKGNEIILAEFNTSLDLISSAVFSVESGVTLTVPKSILVDDEGYLVVVGYQWFGSESDAHSFVFRFNYATGILDWFRKYDNEGSILQRVIIEPTTGDYIVCGQNGHPSEQSAVLIRFNKDTGDETIISNVTHHPLSDTYWSVIYNEGYYYLSTRYQYYGGLAEKMRSTITKLNSDGTVVYAKNYITDTLSSARLYGADIAIKGDQLYLLSHGDDAGTSTAEKLFITATNLDGDFLWNKQYNYSTDNDGIWHQITPLPSGLLVAGSRYNPSGSSGHGGDIFLLKISDSGVVEWSKTYPFKNDSYYYMGKTDVFEVIGDYIFAIGFSDEADDKGVVMRTSLSLEGYISEDCSEVIELDIIDGDDIAQNTDLDDISYEGFSNITPAILSSELEFYDDLCPLLTILSDTICSGSIYTLPDGSEVTTSGVYEVILLGEGGVDSTVITILEVVEEYIIEYDINLCDGDIFELPDGSVIDVSGTYLIESTSVDGCDSKLIYNIIFNDIIENATDTNICEGELFILPDGTAVSDTGVYLSELVSIFGCDSIIYTTVGIMPTYNLVESYNICSDESFVLPSGEVVSTSGTYISNLLTLDGCDSIIQIDLQVYNVFDTLINAIICEGETYPLPDGTNAGVEGIYEFNYLSAYDCDSSYTIQIQVIAELEDFVLFSSDTLICDDLPFIYLTVDEGIGNVLWSTGSSSFSILVEEEGLYSVIVSNDCFTYTDSVLVSTCPIANLPNAFSPNGDDNNDYFQLIHTGISSSNFLVEIYNRWGQKIFASSDLSFKWDGKYEGIDQEIGVYVYIIYYDINGSSIVKSGTITLVR
ncbi:MAG: hypothetical protein ABR94_05300 [Sphingobacteriales bacterium BACL12 MAG-120802-bin5]|jgi:gliding motility-associated-like protein|nr:MAG: hypothetical protein ABR94_05300 [Sphingobacteriales bacterium BACL12 MAG-120802-bin5]